MDYTAILKERGFSDEEITTLLPRLDPIFGSITSARDGELSTKLSDLKTKEDKLTSDMAEWASMTASEKQAAGDLRQKIDDAQAEIFRREQIIVRLAEEQGVDPKTLLGKEPVKEPVKKAEFDPGPLREQFGQSINYVLRVSTELPMIADEYLELTGKRLDTRALRAEIEKRAQKNGDIDPQKIADELFNLPQLRTDKAAKDHETERLRYIEEGRQMERSEAALPPGSLRPTNHNPGPLMAQVAKTGSILKRPQPGDRVQRALSSAASGRYANWKPGEPQPAEKSA